MTELNQMELNSIRELVASHHTQAAKLKEYAEKCNDAQIIMMFQQAAQQANQSAQNLLQML